MRNSAFFISMGGAGALAFAFALTVGCSSSDSTNGAAGAAGESAQGGTTSSGGSAAGGSTSSGGTSSSAGTTAIAGTSSGGNASGGSSSSAGSSPGGASGGDCATLKAEAECKAAPHCYPIYTTLECPGSGAPCPTMFSSCANTGCGPSCGTGSVCVGETTEGGAVEFPDDAGACPEGSHLSGQSCQRDPVETFSCKPAPAACNGKIDCACASSACSGMCQSAENNQIDCVELVP
ncbi:MAG TPA: hypothetical protein VGM44_18570 [Polyangiaceae bacterium]